MPDKIMLIRFGSLGDVILTSPTVLNLKLSFPESKIYFLTKEVYAPIVRRFEGVDEVVTLPSGAGVYGFYKLLHRLDTENFDLVIDLHRKLRSWLTRKMTVGNQKLIYPKRRLDRRQAVRRHGKVIPSEWPHTIDLYNDTVEQASAKVLCRRPQISFNHSGSTGKNQSRRRILMAPGAAHPTKNWGLTRFADVTEKLMDSIDCEIIWATVTVSKEISAVTAGLDRERFNLLINEPLDSLADLIAECDLTLSNDSGLMHLSSAVGTPTLGLFGPTHPVLGFAPRGLFDQVLQIDESCRPCSLHGQKTCFREAQYCFEKLEPSIVIARMKQMLNDHARLSPALLVDRDGTVIVEKDFISDPDQVQLLPGSAEALRLASEAGYKIVILSNQSGVARGYFGIDRVEAVNNRLLSLLAAERVDVDGLYYCPYYEKGSVPEFSIASELRKPRPGMAEQAAIDLNLDLRRSIVIGDKFDDYCLGKVIGGRSAMVLTGYGEEQQAHLKGLGKKGEKDLFDNLLKAVQSEVTKQL